MQDGKKFSRIVEAIAEAENHTTGEVRVHISKRWIEPDAMKRARTIFLRAGMKEAEHANGVLLYVNLRRKKLALYGDEAIHRKLGQKFWERVTRELAQDLRGTHHENAIALAVQKIGVALARHFPCHSGPHPDRDHSHEVTSD